MQGRIMMMKIVVMMMVMMTVVDPMQSVVRAKCLHHVRRWSMEQVVADRGGGVWNVEAWVIYFTSFTIAEWWRWISQEKVWTGSGYRLLQPEEWEE